MIKKRKNNKAHAVGITFTTGDLGYNIDQFNKRMGTCWGQSAKDVAPNSGYVNGDTTPSGSTADSGNSSGDAGEGGAVGESLNEDKDFEIKIQDNPDIIEDEKELEPPISLDYFPNNMGINLSSVKSEKWTEQDDGQLKKVEIEFDPATEEEIEEQGGLPGEKVEESLNNGIDLEYYDLSVDDGENSHIFSSFIYSADEEEVIKALSQLTEKDEEAVEADLDNLVDKYYDNLLDYFEDKAKEAGLDEYVENKADYDDHSYDDADAWYDTSWERESLEEKLDYNTQKQKMDQLNRGTRDFNARAAGDDKLIFNRKVCKQEGYWNALATVEQEMYVRGLIKTRTNRVYLHNLKIELNDFDIPDCQLVHDLSNDAPALISKAANELKGLILDFIYASVLQNIPLAAQFKDYILEQFTITAAELKDYIRDLISDANIKTRLANIVNSLTESMKGNTDMQELDEAQIYSHKKEEYFEIPDEVQILPQQQVEDFVKQMEPEELFTVGYITPVYFYAELDSVFSLVKATELEGYTGMDYRDANVDAKDKDARLANAKRQINTYADVTDKNQGHMMNAEGEKFSTRYRATNKLALNPLKSDEYTEYEYETDANGDVVIDPKTKQPIIKKDAEGNNVVKVHLDLSKILFYPKVGSRPNVTYYLDLHDGKGFSKVGRDILVNVLYKRVIEAAAIKDNATIEKEATKAGLKYIKDCGFASLKDFMDAYPGLSPTDYKYCREKGLDPTTFLKDHPYSKRWTMGQFSDKVKKTIEQDSATISTQDLNAGKGYSPSTTVGSGGLHHLNKEEEKPQVRALYSNQVYYISGRPGTYGKKLHEGLDEAIAPLYQERANEFKDELFNGGSLEDAKTDIIHDLQDKGIKVTYTTWIRELVKAFLIDRNSYSETRAHLLERAIITLHKDLKDEFNFLKKECNESLTEDSHTVQSYKDWINEPTFAEDKDDVIEDIKNNKCLTDSEKLELLAMISKKTESLNEAKRYVKRYYVRPQNIFCSNKEDILKALLRVDGENCSIYSLKDLPDHDDVHLLKPSDIIYYYDNGILYDKNHVKVMDYDLNVKHEEERKKFANAEAAPESQFADAYDDRLTDVDLKDKEAVANYKAINEEASLTEAVDFKDIEAKKAFNRLWKDKFNQFLAGKEIYTAKQEKGSYSRGRATVEKVFVGANTGNLIIKTVDARGNSATYSVNDFGEYHSAKPHIELEDEDLTLQIVSLADAYKADFNEAAKTSNSRGRGEAGRIERSKKTADAVLKSPKCEELKQWLKEHITGILFKLPICSDPGDVVLDDTLDPVDFEKIAEKWQYATDKFLDLWKPALIEGTDFVYRDAVKEPESISAWYKFRGPACIITFTCDLTSSEVPEEINEMIALAKRESEDAGVDRSVNYDVKGNRLDSYYFGRALGEIFNYNINFYKKDDGPAPEEQENDNPFDQSFDSFDAYGDKVESLLREAKEEVCCICGEPLKGYGNNPAPYKESGKCCDACNRKFVIPARLQANLDAMAGDEEE